MPDPNSLSPETAQQLAALGYLTPDTAAQFGANSSPAALPAFTPGNANTSLAQPIPNAPAGGAPVGPIPNAPVGPIQAMPLAGAPTPAQNAAALQAAGINTPLPGITGVPANLDKSTDLANPTSPPPPPAPGGRLLGDVSVPRIVRDENGVGHNVPPEGTVSLPVMHRDMQGVLHPGPPQVSPGAAGVPAPGSVPGAPGLLRTPAEKPKTATEEWLATLQQQQRDIATRGVLLNDAVKQKADAEAAKSMALQASTFQAVADAKDRMAQEASARAQAQKDADAADAQSKARVAEVANRKIDPNRFWHNMSFPQQVLGVLGMALGAFGAARTHSPNFAFQMLQSAVDRDVAAQRDDIQNSKDANAELDKMAHAKYGRSMDQAQFDAHQRLDAYNYALQQSQAQAGSYDSDISQANAQILQQQLQGKVDEEKATIAQQIYGVQRQQEVAKANAAAAPYFAAQKAAKERQEQYNKLVSEGMERGLSLDAASAVALTRMGVVGGKTAAAAGGISYPGMPKEGGAGNKGQQEVQDARAEIQQNIDELRKLADESGHTGLWSADAKARANAIRATIIQKLPLADVGSKRPPSESDRKILEDRVPDVTSSHPWSGSTGPNAQLDVLSKSLAGPAPAAQAPEDVNGAVGFTPGK